MPEPFKNVYSIQSISHMAHHLSKHEPEFNCKAFILEATDNLEKLEMKQRSTQIITSLKNNFPDDFPRVAACFLKSLASPLEGAEFGANQTYSDSGINGWLVSPIADFVGIYGLAHFDISMNLLKELTKRFSAEFGIRYFIKSHPEKTLTVLSTWLSDNNHHVRRLVSEGTRPRLPWGIRLHQFIDNPQPLIQLLDRLKDDESEYVRRSVANNLNDIAKDHPQLVSRLACEWLIDATPNRLRLVKHACRTLFKQGHKETLSAFGFGKVQCSPSRLTLDKPQIKVGESLSFKFETTALADQKWMLDYIVYHQKANGKMSPKVFKWKQLLVTKGEKLSLVKLHAFKQISTRKYYMGAHQLEILINGTKLGNVDFDLLSR